MAKIAVTVSRNFSSFQESIAFLQEVTSCPGALTRWTSPHNGDGSPFGSCIAADFRHLSLPAGLITQLGNCAALHANS